MGCFGGEVVSEAGSQNQIWGGMGANRASLELPGRRRQVVGISLVSRQLDECTGIRARECGVDALYKHAPLMTFLLVNSFQ